MASVQRNIADVPTDGEPETGANAISRPRTQRDLVRFFSQVSGSPFASVRQRQTPGTPLEFPFYGSAGDPPLGAGQACGQVCASPGIILLLGPAPLGGNFAVGRPPEPDIARIAAKHK
jgi:hypothetical protein